jgi:hypothetical protein
LGEIVDNNVIVVVFRIRARRVVGSQVFLAGQVSLLEDDAFLVVAGGSGWTWSFCGSGVYA